MGVVIPIKKDKFSKILRFKVGDVCIAEKGDLSMKVKIAAIGPVHHPADPCDYTAVPYDGGKDVFGRKSGNDDNYWSVLDEWLTLVDE